MLGAATVFREFFLGAEKIHSFYVGLHEQHFFHVTSREGLRQVNDDM